MACAPETLNTERRAPSCRARLSASCLEAPSARCLRVAAGGRAEFVYPHSRRLPCRGAGTTTPPGRGPGGGLAHAGAQRPAETRAYRLGRAPYTAEATKLHMPAPHRMSTRLAMITTTENAAQDDDRGNDDDNDRDNENENGIDNHDDDDDVDHGHDNGDDDDACIGLMALTTTSTST